MPCRWPMQPKTDAWTVVGFGFDHADADADADESESESESEGRMDSYSLRQQTLHRNTNFGLQASFRLHPLHCDLWTKRQRHWQCRGRLCRDR